MSNKEKAKNHRDKLQKCLAVHLDNVNYLFAMLSVDAIVNLVD